MGRIVEKNRKDWDSFAGEWDRRNHCKTVLSPVLKDPAKAFHPVLWSWLSDRFVDWDKRTVCVPSSGDNLAVFAFALLGARVVSCDISQNQLDYARQIAVREGFDASISWVGTDTMTLDGVLDGAF